MLTCSNGTDALEMIKKHSPDIVLLDIHLPDMNGLDILEEIRTDADLQIIMVTQTEDRSLLETAFSRGANDYILKSFTEKEFVARVKRAIMTRESILARRIAENRLRLLNDCLLSLTSDIAGNMAKLVETTGKLLGADNVFYNRLKGDGLETVASFKPLTYSLFADGVKGHICYDVITSEHSSLPVVLNNLLSSSYAVSDPNVTHYGIESYIGYPIKVQNKTLGVLCAVFTSHRILEQNDEKIFHAIALALQIEEERRNVQNALSHSQHRYKVIVEDMPVLICRFKPDGKLVFANSAYRQHFGLRELRSETESFFHYVPKDSEDNVQKALSSLSAQTPLVKLEVEDRSANGVINWMDWTFRALFDSANTISEIQGVGEDITSRKMIDEQKALYTRQLEQASEELGHAYHIINEDLRKAQHIHQRFLPSTLPQIERIACAAHFQPAKALGGDFYNVVRVGHKLLVYIADVTGHGLDSALLTIFIRETINRLLVTDIQPHLTPKSILENLTLQYHQESFPDDYFICICVAVIDLRTKVTMISNAGFHVPPLTISRGGQAVYLECKGVPISLAVPLQFMEFETVSRKLQAGDSLLFSTDGLVEATNNGQVYGEERLRQVYEHNRHLPPEVIIEAINEDFRAFNPSLLADDDISFLAIQHLPEARAELNQEISSVFSNLEPLQSKLEQFIQSHIANYESLVFGLMEVVTNAIEHGNKEDPTKKVYLYGLVTEKYLLFEVEDQGAGFSWQKTLAKTFALDNFSERGRGIQLTKMCFDYVQFNDRGNRVHLLKKILEN